MIRPQALYVRSLNSWSIKKSMTEGNMKGQNVKNQSGKITCGITANCFINSWQCLCKGNWINKDFKFIPAAVNFANLIDQGLADYGSNLTDQGLAWAMHGFYIFTFLSSLGEKAPKQKKNIS